MYDQLTPTSSPRDPRSPSPTYRVCGHPGQVQLHHVASRAVAPDAVIPLCRSCHEALHANNAPLWRTPRQDPGQAALARLGTHRLAESVEFLSAERPNLYLDGSLVAGVVTAYAGALSVVIASAVALDAIAELLLASTQEVRR